MVKTRLAIEQAHALKIPSATHRATFATTSVADGCTLISAYLRHSEGMSADNQRLLEELAAELAQIRGPWIIGMDANMEPAVLRESKWPELVGGTIVVWRCGA